MSLANTVSAMEDFRSTPSSILLWVKLDDTHVIARLHRKFWLQGGHEDKLLNAFT
jgi:hypothetical protein